MTNILGAIYKPEGIIWKKLFDPEECEATAPSNPKCKDQLECIVEMLN
jgi:hypothetical protein